MTWRETFAAQYALLFPGPEPGLAAAVNAWLDSRMACGWVRSAPAAEISACLGDAGAEFTAAGAEAVALAARQLARHHDSTLRWQLGFTAAQVAKIRLWASGTDAQFKAAADLAYSQGRALHVSDLTGPPMLSDLPPMLGGGVTVPADAS